MATSNLQWEASKNSICIETLWENDGFTFELVKRFISKDYYNVSKDGTTVRFEVYTDPKCKAKLQYNDFLKWYDRIVEMHLTYDGKNYVKKGE